MECPSCNSQVDTDSTRCPKCNFGIRQAPKRDSREGPAYLGDRSGVDTPESELARKFQCPSCRSFGADQKQVSLPGNTLTRVFNINRNEFLMVTCKHCGLCLLYNCKAIGLSRSFWFFVDLFCAFLVFVAVLLAVTAINTWFWMS